MSEALIQEMLRDTMERYQEAHGHYPQRMIGSVGLNWKFVEELEGQGMKMYSMSKEEARALCQGDFQFCGIPVDCRIPSKDPVVIA
jgi:hypothetical protein